MRIAIFSHYARPEIGAPPARIWDLSRHWIECGHQVDVVSCVPNHPGGKVYPGYSRRLYQQESLDGVRVHRHWTYITPNRGILRRSLGHLSYLPGAMYSSRFKLPRPDVAIGTSPTFFAAMAALHAARRFRIPFIMEVRDLWPALFAELGMLKRGRLYNLLEAWELWMYRKASRIVTVTESFRNNLSERGVPQEKIGVIPNGADVDFWDPSLSDPDSLRREIGLGQAFTALYIGAHGVSQGLKSVLEGARRLQQGDQGVQFLFVGDGAEKKGLMSYASEAGLENVRFHEPVGRERVRDFYALADVCLVPLRNVPLFDTFIPSKMFEVMSMATPVLGAVKGEAAQILDDSKGAVVVPPEDPQALAEALVELAASPGRCRDMGRQGRAFVAERFSRKNLAERYLRIIGQAGDSAT